MIFYKKKPTMPEIIRKTASFSEFSSPSVNPKKGGLSWTESLNFTFQSGALTGEIGAKAVCENSPLESYEIEALYFYDSPAKSEILFLTSTALYRVAFPITADGEVSLILNKAFSSPPQGILYESTVGRCMRLLLYSEGYAYVYDGNGITTYTNVPAAVGAGYFNDRLFLLSAAKPGRVCFSHPLDETDWTAGYAGAGYIDLDPGEGKIRGIFAGEAGVRLLRDGRITLLKAKGENNDFSLSHTLFPCGKIYDRSAQPFGDGLVFLCDDGLYFFEDGGTIRVAPELTARLPVGKPLCSGVWNALYFFSYTDTDGKDRVLFASLQEKSVFFSDLSVKAAVSHQGECYFLRNGTLAAFTATAGSGDALHKTYQSAPTDFGLGTARKILRSVTLEGEGEFTLTILSDTGGKKKFTLSPNNGSAGACPVLKGRTFTFSIESVSAKCRLKKLSATVDLPQGGVK